MLSFEEFQDYCKEHLVGALPDGYENAAVTVNEVIKNNGRVLTALTVMPEGQNVAPNIYLDGFYMEYETGTDLDTIMDEMADLCMSHIHPSQDISNIGQQFRDVDFVRDRIIMVAVNREKNAELLSDCPHTNREDLALIYKVLVSSEDAGTATITIHNDHLAFWDMTVEEVHELAMKNTRELLPVTVQSMNEVMREMFSRDGMDEEMLEALFEDRPADEQMFVISNESKVNGAASIFYEDVLTDLAAKMGTDLYVLPSSIHECIAVSCKLNTPDALAEMVSEINEGQVAKEEQLSDHVYYFNAQEKTLTLADTSTMELGLSAAENREFYETAQTNTEGSRPRHHR